MVWIGLLKQLILLVYIEALYYILLANLIQIYWRREKMERYHYEDLSPKAKERAYKDTLKFYDYAIKEMLENTVFRKDGKRIECINRMDILI